MIAPITNGMTGILFLKSAPKITAKVRGVSTVSEESMEVFGLDRRKHHSETGWGERFEWRFPIGVQGFQKDSDKFPPFTIGLYGLYGS